MSSSCKQCIISSFCLSISDLYDNSSSGFDSTISDNFRMRNLASSNSVLVSISCCLIAASSRLMANVCSSTSARVTCPWMSRSAKLLDSCSNRSTLCRSSRFSVRNLCKYHYFKKGNFETLIKMLKEIFRVFTFCQKMNIQKVTPLRF